MKEYGFLTLPSSNRVYAQAASTLVQGELEVFNRAVLGYRIERVSQTSIGGLPYVTFAADGLAQPDIRLLSNLSALYALFEISDGRLRPLTLQPLDKFPGDLLTIQKYPGKTNEQFTKLLLNVTALFTDSPDDLISRRLRVLDPLCGRGTTLNQAMMYGFDAAGVEISSKDFEAYSAFIRTWLKNNRVKHQAELARVRREHVILGRRLHVSLGVTKEHYKERNDLIDITAVNADTLRSADFFRAGSFDLIVTDAPYGVQHGSRARDRRLTRSPAGLLADAMPVWAGLLRRGGAIGIAWNSHVASREELAQIMKENAFEIMDPEGALNFRHRVDQAIVRDLIVARRP
jgi:RMKL-like, methyltransferase domain